MGVTYRREGNSPSPKQLREPRFQLTLWFNRKARSGTAEMDAPLLDDPLGRGDDTGVLVKSQVGAVDELDHFTAVRQGHGLATPVRDSNLHELRLHGSRVDGLEIFDNQRHVAGLVHRELPKL